MKLPEKISVMAMLCEMVPHGSMPYATFLYVADEPDTQRRAAQALPMTQDPVSFIHSLRWADLPPRIQDTAKLNLLDLLGIAVGGLGTDLSRIIRDHAGTEFGGSVPMLLDGRTASASGAALAAGMTIDALDGHDGFNPAKGHIGCPLFAGLWPLALETGCSGETFLEALVVGYEIGARVSVAQHATAPDYRTSGSWGAVVVAAAGARLLGLTPEQTSHAMGIAEYHGPRSQMMRCIDHPTMLKDGAGWGAMAGVSALKLAASGFTGAPAITVEDAPDYWANLGARWYICEQYYKPIPVCRWAQAPVEAVLALRLAHSLTSTDIAKIKVETFHEAIRLATSTPKNTEQAQYSTSFPTAVAMVRGAVGPNDITGDALHDPEVLRLSEGLVMQEADKANAVFPGRRIARVQLVLTDGRRINSDWTEPKWDATAPPTPAELRAKYDALARPVLGQTRADRIAELLDVLDTGDSFSQLLDHLSGAP